jgi:hypothetical protein
MPLPFQNGSTTGKNESTLWRSSQSPSDYHILNGLDLYLIFGHKSLEESGKVFCKVTQITLILLHQAVDGMVKHKVSKKTR